MCFDVEDRVVEAACIIADDMTAFCSNYEIMLNRGVPLCRLDVLIDALLQGCAQVRSTVTDVHHVQTPIVATRKEHLLICSVPTHHLHLVCVDISVGGLASGFV